MLLDNRLSADAIQVYAYLESRSHNSEWVGNPTDLVNTLGINILQWGSDSFDRLQRILAMLDDYGYIEYIFHVRFPNIGIRLLEDRAEEKSYSCYKCHRIFNLYWDYREHDKTCKGEQQ